MKSIQLVLATACLVAVSAHAADPTLMKKNGVLVDPAGMTVYTYDKDSDGKSACVDGCLTNWPAVKAPAGDLAAPYSAITRPDGTRQLAYNGKPLYTFVKDKKAGDKAGDQVKNVWHTVTD